MAEAVDYRLAMLGLSDDALPENVRGVDRAALGDAYLVVYSSSTKMSRAHEADERRLAHLLRAKGKRYEMVYLDVRVSVGISPPRRRAGDRSYATDLHAGLARPAARLRGGVREGLRPTRARRRRRLRGPLRGAPGDGR